MYIYMSPAFSANNKSYGYETWKLEITTYFRMENRAVIYEESLVWPVGRRMITPTDSAELSSPSSSYHWRLHRYTVFFSYPIFQSLTSCLKVHRAYSAQKFAMNWISANNFYSQDIPSVLYILNIIDKVADGGYRYTSKFINWSHIAYLRTSEAE
jgi:hypothetical protein